jgi:DtxR family Mn-dependent transcriptional regulator
MIKKLADKKLVSYQKYQGVDLTKKGKDIAISIIRNHRLWEVFLVEKLNFKWDEVHELAEELEHINTHKLTERLDEFLDFPKYDPHGDPIPDKDGKQLQLVLGTEVKVIDIVAFDSTMKILVNGKAVVISHQASKNLIVKSL